MEGTIADVRCPSCGAPARYDILSGQYRCAYCGGAVGVKEALAQKQGFRSLRQKEILRSARERRLLRASCTGCGAALVFEEGEAMQSCAFCGRALVRQDYLASEELPELILPFRLTQEEAAACLEDWRRKNALRPEARLLRGGAARLESFYLPYELVRGPVSCRVSRMDGGRVFRCGGYVDKVFVNCSAALNNALLDGMEPFELDELREFDFSFAAGQRIRIPDIDAKTLEQRIAAEVSDDYAPVVRRTLESRAVEVSADAGQVLRLPVLLPVYYLRLGKTAAAVNGQTGRVSVQAAKDSHYLFLPWWLKALLATLLISGGAFGAFRLFSLPLGESLTTAGMLALTTFVITLAVYGDTPRNPLLVKAGRRIFRSDGAPLRRADGVLVRDRRPLKKDVTPPVFYETLDGKETPVQLVFSSPLRKARMALLALLALFLPVIVALFLNGFDFQRLTLGGSAVWFCIAVPVVPIYVLKFGVIELYEKPWIYVLDAAGRRRRWRKKREWHFDSDTLMTVVAALFVPPISLAVWFGIICFCVMCYLTAFGFD